MKIKEALNAHTNWKICLRWAIAEGTALAADDVGRDDLCALGRWLHGPLKQHFGELPAYRECVRLHAAFHEEAAKVVADVQAKNLDEAERALEPEMPSARCSCAVVRAISELQRQTLRSPVWDEDL